MFSIHQRVLAFHQRHSFSINEDLSETPVHMNPTLDAMVSSRLEEAAVFCSILASGMGKGTLFPSLDTSDATFSTRLMRAHLILEEVSETLVALARRDPVKLADGIADSVYVLFGTGVAFGIATDAAVYEVCDSNDTKAVRQPGDVRLRSKGPGYRPPDFNRLSPKMGWEVTFADEQGNDVTLTYTNQRGERTSYHNAFDSKSDANFFVDMVTRMGATQ